MIFWGEKDRVLLLKHNKKSPISYKSLRALRAFQGGLNMKITDLVVTMFNWKSPVWRTGSGSFGGHRLLGIVTVQTDAGIEGHAFLGSSRQGADAYAGPLIEFVKPAIMGANPLDIGAIWHRLWKMNRSVSTNAIGAVDVALWDVAGKVANLPIHRLLGTCRNRVPAYASSGWLPTPEAYGEEAQHFKALGWTAYKIHPHAIPREDIKICQAVRKAVGDDMTLMLDSTWAYGYEDAVRVGRAIEELNYFWYEDPLVEEDLYNYIKLRNKLDIPIMSTEYAPGRLYGMAQWIQQMATDILRGDVAVTGGITPLIKIAHLAEAFRMKCEIHHGGNSLNNVANLHVTMAVNNCDYYEVFPCSGANKFGLVEDIEVDDQGLVYAPEKPGLGYEVDWDLVKRETVQVAK
jgi:L-alanine-DL-glutamate epimerase-like enolase superfamily enzyme